MQHPFPAAFVSLQWLWWLPSQTINWWHGIRYPFEYNCRVSNDIEAPKALDVQLALPERGKSCFGGHPKWWQKDFSPALNPHKPVKSKCRAREVPNGPSALKVVSRH